MGGDLVEWVSEQIDHSEIDDEVGLVVLAALEGDQQLDDYLSTGDVGPGSDGSRSDGPALTVDSAAPVGAPGAAFLSFIQVEGFRGIGPATTLMLQPRPGLTVVAGRNGSGKSSISEALELALTGGTYRWKKEGSAPWKNSAQWKQQWRNLHHPTAGIKVGVVEENRGAVTVTTRWAADTSGIEARTTKTQRNGQKQQDGLGDLGWERHLERFRPILSYDELGGMLEGKPSELHDAIAKVLGIEQISDALKRVQARHKDRKGPGGDATRRRKELMAEAGELDDERAAEAARLLEKPAPDLAALRAVVIGSGVVDSGPVPSLRVLAGLTSPAKVEAASAAATRLREAVAGLADAGTAASTAGLARLQLLERALQVHADHGDMTCPVCRCGRLDAHWASTSRELVADERRDLDSLRRAQQELAGALEVARGLLLGRPTALGRAPLPQLEDQVAAARVAWDAWVAAPHGSEAVAANALADHLELHVEDVEARVDEVRVAAFDQLEALDTRWQPLATRIGSWCDAWEAWQEAEPSVGVLAAAEKWLKGNSLRLKNDRLDPIREGAKVVWAALRQESNVEIGDLSLTGSENRRQVKIDAHVDGVGAGTLAVLSQGELHALALALFLPRATMAESPFRFLILDDPVQAMDPAKVDGLVRLLSDLAETHQVIVLSHDDRLPAAVRRAGVGATILEVTRGKDSRVLIRLSSDPATRYLEDAFGMVKEREEGRLSEAAMRRTLPGLLRFAVEAAAKDRYFTGALRGGATLVDVETTWTKAGTTREKVALAVFGEPRPNHELDTWAGAPYRKHGLRNVGPAMHNGLQANLDPREAARDVQRLVKDIADGGS